MSDTATQPEPATLDIEPRQLVERASNRSFVAHAKLIGFFTLISRVLGLAREVVAGHYLGTGLVASAFTVAFTIPNLFRKLFGEGALSAAFIPLYAQALKAEAEGRKPHGIAPSSLPAKDGSESELTAVGRHPIRGLRACPEPASGMTALGRQFTFGTAMREEQTTSPPPA